MSDEGEFTGRWRVERVSGLLPPVGLRKRIGPRSGSTGLGPLPLARFRVRGRTLDYVGWPLRDELRQREDGALGVPGADGLLLVSEPQRLGHHDGALRSP